MQHETSVYLSLEGIGTKFNLKIFIIKLKLKETSLKLVIEKMTFFDGQPPTIRNAAS